MTAAKSTFTPQAKRLLESLAPADQALMLRFVAGWRTSRGRWSALLTPEQQRAYRNWSQRERRRRVAERAANLAGPR